MGAGFTFDMEDLESGLSAFDTKADAAIKMYAATSALKLQNDARRDAPWVDRTGHARQRLVGDVMDVPDGYELRLAHGVDYGVFLELANEKKYAAIAPAINLRSTEIIRGLNRLLERIG